MTLVGEFVLFLKKEKKWWLVPVVIAILALGSLLVYLEGSVLAPLLYPLF